MQRQPGGGHVVVRKSPDRDCYVQLPMELTWRPSDATRERLLGLLSTSFAGSGGFDAFLAMNALAFGLCLVLSFVRCIGYLIWGSCESAAGLVRRSAVIIFAWVDDSAL